MRIRSINAIAIVLVLAATMGVQSASAQSDDLKARIPFEFQAAGKLFPAGTYIVKRVNPTTLRLQDSEGQGVFISAGRESVRMEEGNWIVFNRYGQRSFLAGAYWSGYSTSVRVPASRSEQEVAKVASQPTPIRIAAR